MAAAALNLDCCSAGNASDGKQRQFSIEDEPGKSCAAINQTKCDSRLQ